MQKILFLLLLGALLWGSCRRDELINNVTVKEDPPVILVVSSFKGKVTDEAGNPVANAVARVFKSSTITNAQGLFVFENVEAPKGSALISVEKDGYFLGASMAGNSADGKNYTRVTLLNKGIPQKVTANTGGELQWPGGLKTTIKANTLRRSDGAVYNGEANVYARWLNPADESLGRIMPGALMARNAGGSEQVLATYGMVALNLETLSGEPLQLRDGEMVACELPIPPELEPTAPTEIPLWYFDLEEERWLLKGACQKSGGFYHCGIPASGYWNCDVALEPICLSGAIFQGDSTPAYYTKVIVEDLTDNFIYWGYTDINGFFCGSVPKAAPLRIRIEDLCGNTMLSMDIGPYAQDFQLADIYLPVSLQEYFIHVTGQLLDCMGAPVTLGQVAVEYPGKIRIFPLSAPGMVDFQLALHCIEFPELFVTGYDLTNFKSTPLQIFSDSLEIELGALSACQTPEEYFNISVGTENHAAAPTRFFKKDNVTSNWMVLEALTVGGKFVLDLRDYHGVDVYAANAIFNTENKPDAPVYPVLNAASPDLSVNITADDGSFITGNLSGTAYDNFGLPQALSGQFNIKKER